MFHRTATEEHTNKQVEICFKKMDHPEAVQFKAAWFFVNHDVDHLDPTSEEEAMEGGERA